MFPKNNPTPPLVSGFPPIDAFLETRGNQSGNKIVSILKTPSPEREGRLSVETGLLDAMETKLAKYHPVVSRPVRKFPIPNLHPWRHARGHTLRMTTSTHETAPAQ